MLELGEVLTPLVAATGGKPLEDEAADAYFEGLQDVPLPTLQEAVGRLMRSERFFPSVADIRGACDRVRGHTFETFTVPAPSALLADDDPRLWYACVACQDSGWAPYWCVGSLQAQPARPDQYLTIGVCGSAACSRFGQKGYGHEFMRKCVCVATNPKIRERLESRRKFAEKAT